MGDVGEAHDAAAEVREAEASLEEMRQRLAAKEALLKRLESDIETLDRASAAAAALPEERQEEEEEGLARLPGDADASVELETAGLEIQLRSAQARARALEEHAQRLDAKKRQLEGLLALMDAGGGLDDDGREEEAPAEEQQHQPAPPSSTALVVRAPAPAASRSAAAPSALAERAVEDDEPLRLLARLQMLLQLESALEAELRGLPAEEAVAEEEEAGAAADADVETLEAEERTRPALAAEEPAGAAGSDVAAGAPVVAESVGSSAGEAVLENDPRLLELFAKIQQLEAALGALPSFVVDDAEAAEEDARSAAEEAARVRSLPDDLILRALTERARRRRSRDEREALLFKQAAPPPPEPLQRGSTAVSSPPAASRGGQSKADDRELSRALLLSPQSPPTEADMVAARLRVMKRFLSNRGAAFSEQAGGAASRGLAGGAADTSAEVSGAAAAPAPAAPLSLSDLMRDESDLAVAGHPRIDLSPAALQGIFRASINDAVVTVLMNRQAQRRERFGATSPLPPAVVDSDIDAAMADLAFPAIFRVALMQVREALSRPLA